MPSALAIAKAHAVATASHVYRAARSEGRNGTRMQRVAEKLDEVLLELDLELSDAERPALPPDEEGVSLCQPG